MSSENSTQLAVILVREFFGPVAASLVDVLLRNGRLSLKAISRLARLSNKVVAEALTVLMLHTLVRWVTVEEGTGEQTLYECFFEDIYPLVRSGTEIELAEKNAGSPEAAPLIQFLLMQGHQRIKDVLAAFTDSTAPDSQTRLKTVQKALNTLLTQQYLRTVSWWNLMPPDEVMNKIALEEEKKLRSAGASTSVSMTAKHQKEAAKAADERIKNMKKDERNMESLKRKAVDKEGTRGIKKRRIMVDEDEEEERIKFDYDEDTTIAVDHKKFAVIVRNQQLVFEVKRRLGPATASVYKVLLDLATIKLRDAREEVEEIGVKTSEIAVAFPDPTHAKAFQDLVDDAYQSRPKYPLTNGAFLSSRQLSRITGDEDPDLPEVNVNGIDRNIEDYLRRKRKVVREHLQALVDDTTTLLKRAEQKEGREVKMEDGGEFEDDEEWRINFRTLVEFVRIAELESIVEHKYGENALRIFRIVVEKHHIDPEQFEKLILLKKDEIRSLLPQLQIGGILETVEIPKASGPDRSKNYHLLSFHESRARAFVLEDLYKTMVRIYQRIDEERVRRTGILKKTARTDVKKDLKRYLSSGEYTSYVQWKTIEERLLGQIIKVDRSVMLLRDI